MSSQAERATSPPVQALTGVAGVALAIIVSCELMLMLDGTIMNVALPEIRAGLGYTPSGLSWVSTAFLLAYGGLMLLGGRIGDIVGRRRTFLVGIAVFTAASLAGGLAEGPGWLTAARAAQGLGAALAAPSTLALLVTNFRGPLQARALSVYSSVTASAMTLGLVLGGVITSALSWRWVLLVNVPIGLLVLALAPRFVAESPRRPGRLDVGGALASVLGLVAVTFGLVRAGEHGWSDPVALSSLIAGVVLVIGFVLIEARAKEPIMPLRLFADRTRAGAFAALLLIPMVTMSTQFLIIQFLQEVLGHNALQAGLAFLPMAAGMLVTAQNAPKLIGRIGGRSTALAGTAILGVGIGWLVPLAADTGYLTGVAGPMLLVGAGMGLVVVPFNIAIMSTVDPAESGVAAGVLQTALLTGASLGIAILSTVYASGLGGHGPAAAAPGPASPPSAETIADSMGTAFTVGLGLVVLAFLVILFTIRSPATANRANSSVDSASDQA
ncbi:MFS transporter [Actinocorallia sp. API 0066]|uniref:MFS transporter n=1 Tax=Actinocorallia sp. API 0066 TaxID=2896846 RepID=UPI001E5559C7|nr:MFS transporter [Actinocorallia sp. API 0066]MCD0449320.1 MFS transporter [Actinocorallia sp. API 0066]